MIINIHYFISDAKTVLRYHKQSNKVASLLIATEEKPGQGFISMLTRLFLLQSFHTYLFCLVRSGINSQLSLGEISRGAEMKGGSGTPKLARIPLLAQN